MTASPRCWHCDAALVPVAQPTRCDCCPPRNECRDDQCQMPGCVRRRESIAKELSCERALRDLLEAESRLEKSRIAERQANSDRSVGSAISERRWAERLLKDAHKAARKALGETAK